MERVNPMIYNEFSTTNYVTDSFRYLEELANENENNSLDLHFRKNGNNVNKLNK